jgi:hypothetical protein
MTLLSLVMAILWLGLALVALPILWGIFVSLPRWAIGGVHKLFRSTGVPDWVFLCGLVALSVFVCATCNPGWGAVTLGVGAVILPGFRY